MNSGFLSQYFEAVAVKKLSAVEVDPSRSNQHEFNGSRELKAVIRTDERTVFKTKFMRIEDQNAAFSEDGTVTWYDARENDPKRTEHRLFYSTNIVLSSTIAGDTVFFARRTDDTFLIIVTPGGSTIERQLYWLFDLKTPTGNKFEYSEIKNTDGFEVDFAARFILDELGIEIEEPENDRLDSIISSLGLQFPNTAAFSLLARNTIPNPISILETPDESLLSFMDWEEKLYRRMERHQITAKFKEGFFDPANEDVEGFMNFSKSLQQRRRSRAGNAFENHTAFILDQFNVHHTRKAETENKAKPDFLFPSIDAYKNSSYPAQQLTMLALKTTCKDRWRQILSEAARIESKHLLTIEPGISQNQTEEMKAFKVQLVIPSPLHSSFNQEQRKEILSISNFIELVLSKQKDGSKF